MTETSEIWNVQTGGEKTINKTNGQKIPQYVHEDGGTVSVLCTPSARHREGAPQACTRWVNDSGRVGHLARVKEFRAPSLARGPLALQTPQETSTREKSAPDPSPGTQPHPEAPSRRDRARRKEPENHKRAAPRPSSRSAPAPPAPLAPGRRAGSRGPPAAPQARSPPHGKRALTAMVAPRSPPPLRQQPVFARKVAHVTRPSPGSVRKNTAS